MPGQTRRNRRGGGTRKRSKGSTAMPTPAATKAVVKRAVRKAKNSAFAMKVDAVINRHLETKYVAQDINLSVGVPSGQTTPAAFAAQQMLPALSQGAADNQRTGNSIQPTMARSYFTVHFNALNTDFTDVTLNLLILHVKGAATAAAIAQVPAGQLLRIGNGLNTDPDATVYTQPQFLEHINRYGVNPEQYTVKKWFRRRFAKGSYDINGVPGANATSQNAINQPCHTFTYKWVPPQLDYQNGLATLPTNHCPVYAIWCTANDGTTYSGQLSWGLRTEMFFKDG